MKVVDSKEVCKPSSSNFAEGMNASEVALSIELLASQLIQIAKAGVQSGDSFDTVERSVLAVVRKMAFVAIELFICLQGDGNLCPEISTHDSRALHRSDNPVKKTIRSIFGVHDFTEYTYSPDAKRTIELRPINTRMSLPDNQWSYLLQD